MRFCGGQGARAAAEPGPTNSALCTQFMRNTFTTSPLSTCSRPSSSTTSCSCSGRPLSSLCSTSCTALWGGASEEERSSRPDAPSPRPAPQTRAVRCGAATVQRRCAVCALSLRSRPLPLSPTWCFPFLVLRPRQAAPDRPPPWGPARGRLALLPGHPAPPLGPYRAFLGPSRSRTPLTMTRPPFPAPHTLPCDSLTPYTVCRVLRVTHTSPGVSGCSSPCIW